MGIALMVLRLEAVARGDDGMPAQFRHGGIGGCHMVRIAIPAELLAVERHHHEHF